MARVEYVEFRVRQVRTGTIAFRVRTDEDQRKIQEMIDRAPDDDFNWTCDYPERRIVDETLIPECDQ
jgi:hypothetical protein